MRWQTRAIAFLHVLFCSPSYATDVAFGVDSLPTLIDSADVIAVTRRIELIKTTDDYRIYSAIINEVSAGNATAGDNMLFAVPRLSDLAQGDLVKVSVLFLTGPMDRATSVTVMGQDSDSLFWLTGANNGRIDRTDVRIAAIRAYRVFQDDEPRSTWITTQLRDSDELLQQSALIELAKPRYANDVDTYALLGATTSNQTLAEATQDLALELLQISASALALPALKDIAVAGATTQERRIRAIRSIGAIPGGDAVLRDLQQEPATRDLATAERERLRGLSAGLPTSDSVLEGLASMDPEIRAQAISDLRTTEVAGDTIALVAPLIDPSASTNLGERAILIDHLGTLSSGDAAALLERVARDRSQSEPLRNAAILALAQMDPSFSGARLQTLATNLEDGTLKELAELLSE